jgi:hypothetical protein
VRRKGAVDSAVGTDASGAILGENKNQPIFSREGENENEV